MQFLDDGWACFSSLREALVGSEHIRKDLLRFGAIWSIKKCCWEPVQELDWIGFTWNCEDGTLKIKESRVVKIINTCKALLATLASFTGLIIPMIPVVNDLARFYTRFSQMAVVDAFSWDSLIMLKNAEINYWLKNIQSKNVNYIFEVEIPKNPTVIKGDASSSGCGTFIQGVEN